MRKLRMRNGDVEADDEDDDQADAEDDDA